MKGCITVFSSGDRLYIRIATGRPRWQFWKAPQIVAVLTRGEATVLKNLLGGALGRLK